MGNPAKKLSNQKKMMNLIKQLTGQGNVLTIQRFYIDYTGNMSTALFLSQLLYWSDKGSDPDGWIYKTHDEWHDEIRLSPYQVRGVTKTLVEMGILETKFEKVGNTPKLHYRLVGDEFTASTMKFLDSQQSRNLTVLDNEVSSPSCLTEITIDYDTEIKNLTSTPSAQKPEASITPKPKPTPKHKQEPQERSNTDLSEVTYCEAGDEFGDLTEKQKPAKWSIPNTPLAERALHACGRLSTSKARKLPGSQSNEQRCLWHRE